MSTSHAEFGERTTGDEVVSAFADRVKGRIFVLTGPSATSIGAATLTSLAKAHPAALVLAGRNPATFSSVVDEIKRIDSKIKVVTVVLDLSSLAGTRKAAAELLGNADIPHIDVLINNAGIMATPFEKTADGIESQFHACHIGHWLFTNLLLPKLRAAREPVVVNVTSSGHRYGTGEFDDVNFEKKPYNAWAAYGQAKCANILFSVSLTERGIKSTAVHPGLVGTGLGKYLNDELLKELMTVWIPNTPNMEALTYRKTLEDGCSTTLVAALDPKVPGAAYLRDCQVGEDVAPQAVDKAKAAKLWELSNALTGEAFA
ncbi:putative short-chain dehydrogenase [Exidia glandulosa HHB12029]|uniref:Putative short-chain dehydrogenase n=1 Tax=Exidia glandulosa HHB12029 TaxID=1314781 RepID=A0A165PPN6_EXIGL|nr:putative short-chain dehydrogenase [Exidia glandulosa HHB12029]